jgi:branched-chain amino acid transport system substrate-binding protein
MRRNFILYGLGTICSLLLFLGCGNDDNPKEPVILGAIYNLSGAQASLDIPSSQGAQLAVDETNREGGLLGRHVLLVLENGETTPKVIAAKTADMLVAYPSMSALMGLSDTDMVLAAAPVAAQNQRLFLTSGATSPKLPAQVPEYLFLACFGDNVQAAAAAEWAYNELPAHTVSVLFNVSDTYTQLLQQYFQTRFTQLGGQILSVEGYTADNIGEPVGRLVNADLIFLSAGPDDAPQAVELLRQAGFTAPILGGDGFDSQDLWQQHPNVSNVFFTTHVYLGADNPNPIVKAFREKYLQAYPNSRPDAFAALGYDTARLLMAAITLAKSADPSLVRKALGETQQFQGVTGSISYTNGSQIPTKSVSIIRLEQGDFKLVKELLPSDIPPP